MAKIITTDIQNYDVSWENYAGTSVEKFIKEKLQGSCGYIYRSSQKEGDFYYLYGFNSVDDYETWLNGGAINPLFRVQLPNIENDIFAANLYTISNTNKLVNLGSGVKLQLKYTSTSTNPSTQEVSDTYNEGTLIISRSANGSSFTEVGRVPIQPIEHNLDNFIEFDITPYLADGDNKIRLRVEDKTSGAISNNINFNSIVNTTLRITNATQTDKPLTAPVFSYYIEGQVAKTLNIEITQDGNIDTFALPIGTGTYIEAPYIVTGINEEYETGTLQVEAWLSVDDTVLESNHIINEFYYSNGQSDETAIILNNKVTSVTNYSNVHFFDFVLYNKPSDVNIKVQINGTLSPIIDYTLNNCEVNKIYEFYNILQVESQMDSISAGVTITTSDTIDTYSITIDNTEKMSPTSGADFVINTNLRNNTEYSPNRIINDVNGMTINSTFTGFNFINDGWVSDDEGYKILRVPANHTLNITYDPLDNLTNGTTIEIDYKVYNVFNDNDVVFRFDSTTNNNPLGFIMNATEAAFYTADNQVKRDQDVVFQEDVRTHMAINIIPNLANTGLNYIRIFINGVMNREMLYNSSDIFKNGSLSITIGSANCDFDLYGMRVYKKSLSALDVRQDYMSTIPTLEEKLAFKNANDILSANGNISFDKASVKYNTLVWTGQLPSYQQQAEYYGNLEINILNDPEHSGTIYDVRDKGQGSSSKGYWKWNQQYDWNKDGHTSYWVDGNGIRHNDGYRLTDNDPAATKLVAKLNWASSMQSHKIGSTALYTDLWREIVGGNSITDTQGYEDVRVSVHEKPFLFFVKDTALSTPRFAGLMTFGSAKFDKATFGYNKTLFPDYLAIEGSDNGMPLTNRQVPWFTDEVIYNYVEEYYEYAGQGSWDYGMGNQDMLHYFIDASNFVYLHSLRLLPYTNDSELTDTTYQYWNTSTYKVVRYDYIGREWVNAGATKTDDEYDELVITTQTGVTPTGNANTDNESFKTWRLNDFKTKIGIYYNVNDVLFSMAFLKLIAASDNRCKNTYEYLDPITHKICLAQDDMDTIMLTDNVGRKTKPYYVEEHDSYTDNGQLKYYFNGQDNVFFSLMDVAYESELQAMMKAILNEMRTVDFGESAEQCLQNYFFDVQEYFPAVAYNETARLLYEEAAVAQAAGSYINGTPAISQSLGDQLQAEKQWFKRRLRYLQSWAKSDPFDVRSSIAPALNFRSILTSGGTNPSYQFRLTPWQWLYPKVGIGQTLGSDNTRVQATNNYTTINLSTDGNTDTFIYGADYYTSFGEFGGQSIGETFQLAGKRLLEFSADSRQVINYEFKPIAMTINCPVLRTLSLYGCSTLGGSIDLTNEKKLVSIDLRYTSLTSVTLPETGTLTTVLLPTLTSITLLNCPNISVITGTYSNLISLTTDNSTLAANAINTTNDLSSIDLRNVDINITNATYSDKLYNLLVGTNNNATGKIQLNKTLTQAEKTALVNKYGNIDSTENSLYIIYTTSSDSSITITGDSTLAQSRTKTYSISYSGNDIITYSWTVTNAQSYTANGNSCSVTAKSDSLEDIVISCFVTRVNTTSLTNQKTIDVIENIYISGITNTDYYVGAIGTYNIPIQYTPSNYTTDVDSINVSMGVTNYGRILNYDKNNITVECILLPISTTSSTQINISITDIDGNTVTGNFDIIFTNPITELLLNGTSIWTKS